MVLFSNLNYEIQTVFFFQKKILTLETFFSQGVKNLNVCLSFFVIYVTAIYFGIPSNGNKSPPSCNHYIFYPFGNYNIFLSLLNGNIFVIFLTTVFLKGHIFV